MILGYFFLSRIYFIFDVFIRVLIEGRPATFFISGPPPTICIGQRQRQDLCKGKIYALCDEEVFYVVVSSLYLGMYIPPSYGHGPYGVPNKSEKSAPFFQGSIFLQKVVFFLAINLFKFFPVK
jgi:hypothetical protein